MARRHAAWTASVVGLLAVSALAGPYAPPPGQAGSTAIGMTDPSLVAWADGYEEYLVGDGVFEVWRTPEFALGPAVGGSYDVVSLGRGGRITMTFSHPIADGPNWDLAVFENGVNDAFLELAYVEVSSDGVDFFRFANDSLTPAPVEAFDALDTTNILGLAGKYRAGFGTPFDLSELAGNAGLNLGAVRYVRLVDVVGDGASLDSSGDAIYDPYPTAESAGFDLDAVGALHLAVGGDTNGDGAVNLADLGILAMHYGLPGGATWANADFTGDGAVNLADLGILATNYGHVSAAVPEPANVVMFIVGAMAVVRRKWA